MKSEKSSICEICQISDTFVPQVLSSRRASRSVPNTFLLLSRCLHPIEVVKNDRENQRMHTQGKPCIVQQLQVLFFSNSNICLETKNERSGQTQCNQIRSTSFDRKSCKRAINRVSHWSFCWKMRWGNHLSKWSTHNLRANYIGIPSKHDWKCLCRTISRYNFATHHQRCYSSGNWLLHSKDPNSTHNCPRWFQSEQMILVTIHECELQSPHQQKRISCNACLGCQVGNELRPA